MYKRKKSRKSKRKKFYNSSKKMKNKKTILMLLVLVTGLTLQQSAEAQEARMNCVDYWLGRTSGIQKSNSDEDNVPFFTPTNVGIIIVVIIAIYYFVIRK